MFFGICVRFGGALVAEATAQWMLKDSLLSLYLATLSVRENHRRSGIGTRLVHEVHTRLPQASSVFLHVHTANGPAIQFYHTLNFKYITRVKKFYSDLSPGDAYLFTWVNPRPDPPDPGLMRLLLQSGVDAGRILDAGDRQWEVEEIIATRVTGGRRQYLLKWCGYAEPTWEDALNLDCPDLIAEFQARALAAPDRSGEPVCVVGVRRTDRGLECIVQHEDGTQEAVPSAQAKARFPVALLSFFEMLTGAEGDRIHDV
jgi:hypothetical protein